MYAIFKLFWNILIYISANYINMHCPYGAMNSKMTRNDATDSEISCNFANIITYLLHNSFTCNAKYFKLLFWKSVFYEHQKYFFILLFIAKLFFFVISAQCDVTSSTCHHSGNFNEFYYERVRFYLTLHCHDLTSFF